MTLQRRLTGDTSVEFMETRMDLPDYLAYTVELDRFLPPEEKDAQQKKMEELWRATAKDKENLLKAMTRFQEKMVKKNPSLTPTDLSTSTWPQVMEEFAKAEEYYRVERRKGAAGAISATFRKLGENANQFSRWLELLPAGDYGSPICAAFKLVFSAAGHMHNIRESMYLALQEIPEAVSKAPRYLRIYGDTKAYQLISKTALLFSAVLNALERIITVMTEKGYKHSFKAFVAGEEYLRPLTESIELVKTRAEEVEREAKICAEERARKMDDTLTMMLKSQQMEKMERDAWTREIAETIAERITSSYQQLLLSNPILDRNTRQPYAMIEDTPESKQRRTGRKHKQHRSRQDSSFPGKRGLSNARLLQLLAYDDLENALDIDRCRLDGQAMSISSKDRASHIASSAQLQKWLLDSEKSAALLILGNTSDPTSLFSPLSFLAAELAHTYSQTDLTVALSYFCGLHVDSWRNHRANAIGLIIGLVGQLLSNDLLKSSFNVEFLDDLWQERLAADDLETLCELFKRLTLQIEQDMVLFCFIDTVSIYETNERRAGLEYVLAILMEIMEETRKRQRAGAGGLIFKILGTDAGASCQSSHFFADDEIYLVDHHIDGGHQGVLDLSEIKHD